MYITRIEIQNIRSIKNLTWEIDAENAAGWHVILGDNGAGKSSFVRSVASALVSPFLMALRQDFNRWIRHGENRGLSRLTILPSGIDGGSRSTTTPILAVNSIQRGDPIALVGTVESLLHEINSEGWFSASYGPFRRFTGGDEEYETLFQSNPRLAPHLSAFSEGVALTESLHWLQRLQFQRFEEESDRQISKAGQHLDHIRVFINDSGLLPHGVRLAKVTSKNVLFVDANENEVPVEELSDGYRSILSLTLDLIRQLTYTYRVTPIFDPANPSFIGLPGVVLIDEVDVHLHPTWQRKIGQWFTTHFPQIQFIVTTHSPLVCQAAERGSIFKLPTPGTDEQGEMITGTERDRLLYGDILDAYSTEVFGSGITRSEKSQEMLDLLADLNFKEVTKGLTVVERKQQERLRAMLPTSAPILNGHDSPS